MQPGVRWCGASLALLPLLLGACQSPEHEGREVTDFDLSRDSVIVATVEPTVNVQGFEVVDSPILGRISQVRPVGASVVLLDYVGDPFLHQVDSTGRLVRSLGRRGEGPGDFAALINLSVRQEDFETVWAFDPRLHRLTGVRLGTSEVPQVIPLTMPFTIRAVVLGRDRIIGLGIVPHSRFVVFGKDGALISEVAGPLLGSDSIPSEVRMKTSLQVAICPKPDGSKFGLAYFGAGRLEIYDSTAKMEREARVPIRTNGSFGLNRRGELAGRIPRHYYSDCAASNQYIYALFAGRLVDSTNARTVANASHVHVFDWGGALIGQIVLDVVAEGLGVDPEDRQMFVVGAGVSGLRRFELEAALATMRGERHTPKR
jgi:hypothetical protein